MGRPPGWERRQRGGHRCGRRAGRRPRGVSIGSGSGWRSRRGCPAMMPPRRQGCPRPLGLDGSERVVACRLSALRRCQGAFCRSPSVKRSPSCALRISASAPPAPGRQLPRFPVPRFPAACAIVPNGALVVFRFGFTEERAHHQQSPGALVRAYGPAAISGAIPLPADIKVASEPILIDCHGPCGHPWVRQARRFVQGAVREECGQQSIHGHRRRGGPVVLNHIFGDHAGNWLHHLAGRRMVLRSNHGLGLASPWRL